MMPDPRQGREETTAAGGRGQRSLAGALPLHGGRGGQGTRTGSFRWKAEASQQGWGGQNRLKAAVPAPGQAKEAAHPDSGHGATRQLTAARDRGPPPPPCTRGLPLLPKISDCTQVHGDY